MANRTAFASMIVTAGLLLAACGTDAVAPTDVTLRVILADDWANTDPVLTTVRNFERDHPGVRVELEGVSFSSIVDSVDVSIRAKEPYDLAQWHAFAAGALGLAEPLDALWRDELDVDEFFPGAYEDVVWAGHPYGIPLDTNAMILVANQAHLDAAGIDPTTLLTYADLKAAAQELTVEDPDGERLGMAHSLSSWDAYGWVRTNGGELVEVAQDGTPTFLLDSPETVEALEFLGSLAREGIAWKPATRDRSLNSTELFLSGSTSIISTGGWDLVEATQRARNGGEQSPVAVVLPLPRGSSGTTRGTALGGSSLFVPKGSKNVDLATQFAIAMIEDERALEMAVQEGRLPVRDRVFDNAAFDDPTLAVVREHLAFASPMKLIAFVDAQHAFTRALESILRGERTAADALGQAQREAEASVAGS